MGARRGYAKIVNKNLWLSVFSLGLLPSIAARTNAVEGNVMLVFDSIDSPDHRLLPVGMSSPEGSIHP
jgi:hypothetical protein